MSRNEFLFARILEFRFVNNSKNMSSSLSMFLLKLAQFRINGSL